MLVTWFVSDGQLQRAHDTFSIVMYNTVSKLLLSPMSFTTLLIAGLDIGMSIDSLYNHFCWNTVDDAGVGEY